jgi:hypothetical protein
LFVSFRGVFKTLCESSNALLNRVADNFGRGFMAGYHFVSLKGPKPPEGRKSSWAQGIGGARSVPEAWQPEAALAKGMKQSETPDSPVFCGIAAKNAQKQLEKTKCRDPDLFKTVRKPRF